MAGKKLTKGSEEWLMFMDYWNLCQELWDTEDTETYWEQVVESVEKFYKKHKNTFAKGLSLTLLNYLEEKYKQQKSA